MAKIAGIELSAQAALDRAEAKETTMQAQNRFARLVLLFAAVLPGLVVQAAVAESQSPPVTVQAAMTDAAPVAAAAAPAASATFVMPAAFTIPAAFATSTASAASAASATSTASTTSTTSTQSSDGVSFGVAMNAAQLDEQRGGDVLVGQNNLTGSVADNTAYKVSTGSNAITQGSFASASGLPTVIQNTGANVLIQNATVLNVRFGE